MVSFQHVVSWNPGITLYNGFPIRLVLQCFKRGTFGNDKIGHSLITLTWPSGPGFKCLNKMAGEREASLSFTVPRAVLGVILAFLKVADLI